MKKLGGKNHSSYYCGIWTHEDLDFSIMFAFIIISAATTTTTTKTTTTTTMTPSNLSTIDKDRGAKSIIANRISDFCSRQIH